jgi:hypothetical protein
LLPAFQVAYSPSEFHPYPATRSWVIWSDANETTLRCRSGQLGIAFACKLLLHAYACSGSHDADEHKATPEMKASSDKSRLK